MSSSGASGREQQGLSLVELMVALAVGVFLLAGAISVFGKSRDLYRTNEATARLQETARYAMSTLEADLRMTNSWGLMTSADAVDNAPRLDIANPPAIVAGYTLPGELNPYAAAISQCGAMWAIRLFAYVEANNDAYGYACAAFGTAVPGSDQLTIRRASTQPIDVAALGASAGQIKLQSSRVRGTLFASGTTPVDFSPPTSESRALVANGYHVDQDSDERPGTPSLRRKQLEVTGGATVMGDLQIVPGVEDLQVEFGADLNGDLNADYFVQPDTVIPPGDQVVAVRVWLLVRAEQQETGFVDGRIYTYASRAAYAPADSFRRVLVSKTVALRNTRR